MVRKVVSVGGAKDGGSNGERVVEGRKKGNRGGEKRDGLEKKKEVHDGGEERRGGGYG